MTAREQLVERVALGMTGRSATGWTEHDHEPVSSLGPDSHASIMLDLVREVLDLALPEAADADALEALPVGTVVLSSSTGIAYRADAGEVGGRRWWWPTGSAAPRTSGQLALGGLRPLVVVWQPEAGDRS